MKLSAQIRAAAKRLTPETWDKGKLFQNVLGTLCMCAHGAMQVECNPSVRRIFDLSPIIPTPRREVIMNGEIRRGPVPRAIELSSDISFNKICLVYVPITTDYLLSVWKDRPDWVRKTDPERGNLEAHYLLGMVGLTAGFNDHPNTTLKQVLEKFEQAAKLADLIDTIMPLKAFRQEKIFVDPLELEDDIPF